MGPSLTEMERERQTASAADEEVQKAIAAADSAAKGRALGSGTDPAAPTPDAPAAEE
jgi:hypothetical protein